MSLQYKEIFQNKPSIFDSRNTKDLQKKIKGELEAKNLTIKYPGSSFNSLNGINFKINAGELIAIVGPVGCGKTTLFNSIVGYHPIVSGNIEFDGQEITHLLVGEIARLGMLRTFQQTRIYTKMNCVDNMQISVSHRKDSKNGIFASRRGEIKDRAEHLLEFVHLLLDTFQL